ncbi:DUF1674 domain-containing protein [Lysobacter sp. GX 14042]|uniref:DUF1674 domain-containing protein n=1 Tax=Lysobacter sp. GX 14042 TaxID=2907155 RepID=UPI001F3E3591|nr:DUF1674 domain-containing protein [Lysobacter sp. GX 14042]MCE7031516.1 DUF1674 domain-containing protein [Lysobacter sp. GX 14042]
MIGQNPPEASPGSDERAPGGDAVPQPAPPPGEDPRAPSGPSREYGGREGPDPVRYGDWEKDGRCIDF